MGDTLFTSSDSVRAARPLRHVRQVTLRDPMKLEMGGQLPSVTVAYEAYGRLNEKRDNAILICHAISGDSHVARHDAADDPGWWDLVVGPGKTIDTDRYFVVCSNVLGGCRGTTGPNSLNPATKRPWGAEFPVITLADIVEVQRRLVDHLEIETLLAVVGGSLGGHQALTWAVRHPTRLRKCAVLASSPRLTSQALAFDVVGRNAILRDPHYHGGQYYDQPTKPAAGLALARMLGHITYLSREAMTEKFDATRRSPRDVDVDPEKMFSVGSYLAYQGHKFVERFDANSYIALTRAMDLFDLGESRGKLVETFSASACRWLVVSFSSDWLFPPDQSRAIVDALVTAGKPVTYCDVTSNCGHDAFLLEDELDVYGRMLEAFLAREGANPTRPPAEVEAPTSIFHGNRLDYDLILDLIPDGSRVLDLGCGSGELLSLLKQRRRPSRLLGVELSEQAIVAAVERGLDVVQSDLEKPLASFPDKSFDVVVLSQTLQAVGETERVLREMSRVACRAIVSFPNFAYRPMRRMLAEEGRSPKSAGPYGHEWYDTPNRRYATIVDFEEFCRAKGFRLERAIYLNTETGERVEEDPNLNADLAIVVISAC